MTDEKGKVIPLREGPALDDIPGLLRQLADGLDNGSFGREVGSVIVIIPNGDDWPEIFCYGEMIGTTEAVGHVETAKTWLIHNIATRQS